jgi:signal transduction histidine kinase/ActR/RegA family two-component response regulator
LASAVALALSQAETKVGQTDLLASELANKALSLANDMLVTNEAVLERLVERRTGALMREVEDRRRAEDALRQGEKLQAIGQLTGGIAHDFNNILQLVFSGATLLRRPGLTEERRSVLLDRIEHAADRASELTSRLLAFARKQALHPKALDLNEHLAAMSDLLRPALGSQIRLETDFAVDLWPVIADPNQLDVAILNLAVNARDAMPPDGGMFTLQTRNVTLEATPERVAGDYVRVAVKDSGSGMTPAVMAHAFEPFYTTKAVGKGTGLGLAQVYGFAKQSGGDVAIESAQGEGTVILLHLLRPTAAALADAARPEGATAIGRGMRQATGQTVLVVDDNLDLASFTASMLEGQGYAILCAANASDALALLDAGEQVDAVFSDVVMPGPMNGIQLAGAVRLRYPKLAVLLATGYSQLLAEWNGPAAAEVLSKPYRLSDLMAALERAFAAVVPGS